MFRVKLNIPNQNYNFIVKIPVRIQDINFGGHVGNDALLSIIHESRVQYLKSFGFDELNAGGNSLIMADVMIAFKNESFYGDILTIKIYATEITAKSFNLMYEISTFRAEKEVLLAQAKTGMVCFDYRTRKIALMTDGLRKILVGN